MFLSYAREDAAAARRIAEALRASGVKVWFDENELRGGDVWDAKIRKQIGDCALFVAIISHHTESREKGYFRLEWKLAVEQTHLLAEGVPFIAPVAIDDTGEARAVVPAEFLRVQWTRLAGGLPTPPFVEQIKRLLTPATPPSRAVAAKGELAPQRTTAGEHVVTASTNTGRLVAVGAFLALALGVGTFFALRSRPENSSTAHAGAPATKASAPPAPAAAQLPVEVANPKSIAVLPFANRSADSGDAYFTDGMHEDILTNLARIRELQVKSRTSVEQYRGATKPIPQIGKELGVAYILQGSVQRAGSTVRITGQLINARTDEHLWAQSYDRELTTANLFAIQSELAQAIARELKAAISPEEKKLLDRRPTENVAAYELYLKAMAEFNRGIQQTDAGRDKLEVLFQAPVTLDPNFALAWCRLSWIHGYKYLNNQDHAAARVSKAKAAIDQAVRLAPDAPETILHLGYFHYFCLSDYRRALEYFERAVRLQPNDYFAFYSMALIHRRTARWPEAMESFRRAAELDPTSTFTWSNLYILLVAGRRFEEASAATRHLLDLKDVSANEFSFNLAAIQFQARGSTREMEVYLKGLEPKKRFRESLTWAVWTGDLSGALHLDQLRPLQNVTRAEMMAIVLAARGEAAAARARLQTFPGDIRKRLGGS